VTVSRADCVVLEVVRLVSVKESWPLVLKLPVPDCCWPPKVTVSAPVLLLEKVSMPWSVSVCVSICEAEELLLDWSLALMLPRAKLNWL
jgi:hypothetical protein